MRNNDLAPLLLSPAEVGQLLGLSRSKIFEMIACGQLPPSHKLGRARKFKRKNIEEWVALDFPTLDQFVKLRGVK
jgi:excisionase family DNA binding protein